LKLASLLSSFWTHQSNYTVTKQMATVCRDVRGRAALMYKLSAWFNYNQKLPSTNDRSELPLA